MSRARPNSHGRSVPEKSAEASGGAWEQLTTLLFAVLIALTIRTFVVEPFRIPSGSMYPTLVIGDHLFVNKFLYGIEIPFIDYRLPSIREPERGDVVVFTVAKQGLDTFPVDRRPDLPREEFVKRIVGLPGDRVEIRTGQISVNGEPLHLQPLDETFEDELGQRLPVFQVAEGARTYRVLDDPARYMPDPDPIIVEPGRYFVLGDNRDRSQDSRYWGTVRLQEIKGPAFILYWSWNYSGGWLSPNAGLLNPLTWWKLLTQETRWERIGDRIH